MREYFKTDEKQFAFKPRTFCETLKQRAIKIKNMTANRFVDRASNRLIKLDENRFLVYHETGQTALASVAGAISGLINLKTETIDFIKPPKTYPSGQEQKAKSTPVTLAFCKLENEIKVFCGGNGISLCVLKGDEWEFLNPNPGNIIAGPTVSYGGIASGNTFYDYTEDGFKRDDAFSSSARIGVKAAPVRKELVKTVKFEVNTSYNTANVKVWNKTGVQGLFCPVDLETGWVEGDIHYAFDGENLIITEFMQDNIIEIKE